MCGPVGKDCASEKGREGVGARRWSLSQGQRSVITSWHGKARGTLKENDVSIRKETAPSTGMIVGAFNKETRGGAGGPELINQQGDMNVLQPQGHQEGTQTR